MGAEPGPDPALDAATFGGLFARLIDDAETFVRAELNVVRQGAYERLSGARVAIALGVSAILLVFAGFSTLLIGLAAGLSRWLGPVGAGAAVAAGALLIAALMLRSAVRRFSAAIDPREDR